MGLIWSSLFKKREETKEKKQKEHEKLWKNSEKFLKSSVGPWRVLEDLGEVKGFEGVKILQ